MSFTLAITGPAGSGKSTVSAKLAKSHSDCVNIDADLVKHFIVSPFIYDHSAEGIKQWELLGTNIASISENYIKAGYNVIINGYIHQSSWDKIVSRVELTHKFLLLPNLQTTIDRDSQRHQDYIMGKKAIEEHHEYFSRTNYFKDFIKIDSTNNTVDEVVTLIEREIAD